MCKTEANNSLLQTLKVRSLTTIHINENVSISYRCVFVTINEPKNANKQSTIKMFWSLQINYFISIQKFSVFSSHLEFSLKILLLFYFCLAVFLYLCFNLPQKLASFFLKISVVPLQFIVSDENEILIKTQFSISVFFC